MGIIDYWPQIIGICLGSYLLGSIPFGKIVGRYARGIDIQKVGSGNIGGTNVGRVLGFRFGALVVGLDAYKAALPVSLTKYFFWGEQGVWWFVGLAFLFAFLGHLFPVWLKFRGGKGISVLAGGLIGLLGIKVCSIILGCWIIVFLFFTKRKMSAANLMVTAGLLLFILAIPILLYIIPITLVIVGLIWWAHRENIQRLARGEEPSIKLPAFFDKLPDNLIGLGIEKLQLLINKLQNLQNQKKP